MSNNYFTIRSDPLGNQWPHVGHLLNHLAEKLGLTAELATFELILVSGVVEGNKYIPAKTHDLVTAFFGKMPQSDEQVLCYISDNSVSLGASRQTIMTNLLQAKHNINASSITYHDALDSDCFEQERAFKEIAAELYTQFELLPEIEKKFHRQQESIYRSSSSAFNS